LDFDVLKLLEQEGYVRDGEDNLVHAEKAFFAARVMRWIRNKVRTEPDFNLQAYLKMLMYYKTGVADLKFSDDGSKLVYRMKNNDKEIQEIVDSLIKSSSKHRQQSSEEEDKITSTTEDADRTPNP
jgi:predicted ATP-binding protein involved in virulence